MDIKGRIDELKKKKDSFLSLINSLESRLARKQITSKQRDYIINSVTQGEHKREYIRKLNISIDALEEQCKPRRNVPHVKMITVSALILVLFLSLFFGFKIPQYTGRAILGEGEGKWISVGELHNSSSITRYDFNIPEGANLTSLKVSGSYSGNFRITLQKSYDNYSESFVVYESKESAGGLITGFVTSESVFGDERNPSDNFEDRLGNLPENSTEEINLTIPNATTENLTVEENELENETANQTAEIDESVLINESAVNLTSNLTVELTNETISLNETEINETLVDNQTSNETVEIGENVEDNTTKEENLPSLNETLPEINETDILVENITIPINLTSMKDFSLGCIDTCNIIIGSGNLSIKVEVFEESTLFLEGIQYSTALPNRPPVLLKPVPDMFSNSTLNLSEYFIDPDGDALLFDSYTVDGLITLVDGDSVLFILLNDSNLSTALYASDGEGIVESNMFNVYPNTLSISMNDSSNVSINLSSYPFIIDEKLKQEWTDDPDASIRVIVKYKEPIIPVKKINEHLLEIKEKAEQEYASKDVDALKAELEQKKEELAADGSKTDESGGQGKGKDKGKGPEFGVTSQDEGLLLEEIDNLTEEVAAVEKLEQIINAEEFDIMQTSTDSEATVLVASDIELLKGNADIEAIYYDAPLDLLVDDVDSIIMIEKARDYFSNTTNQYLDGSDVRICVLDTGVNPAVVGNVIDGFNVIDNSSNYTDVLGHGTSVGYIIYNISPGSQIIAVKVINDAGVGYESDILAGLDYCSYQNTSIISLSIGAGNYDGYCDENPVAIRVNELAAGGVLIVAGSGNDNLRSVKAPACARNALAVGASTKSDSIASFSNYNGATLLVAPGQDISTFDQNNNPVTKSGTSYSAPIVAAVAALKDYDDRKSMLIHTGDILNYSGRQFSRVNAFNYVNEIITNNLSENGNLSVGNATTYTTLASGECYQETATTATACGGLSTGSYSCTGTWDGSFPCTNVYDEVYSTYGIVQSDDIKIADIDIYYQTPKGAHSNSKWVIVRFQPPDEYYSDIYDIPTACWNETQLHFFIRSSYDTESFSAEYNCIPTNGITTNSIGIYEERMLWNISTPMSGNFTGLTTNFSYFTASQLANLSNTTLEKVGNGKIVWNNPVNLQFQDLDRNIIIGSGSIYVNASGLNATFNTSANLSMYGLTMSNPIIMKDGSICTTCTRLSYSGGNLTFNVTGFSNYTVNESTCNNLTTANAIHTVISNLNTTGTCFNITAQNVTLDCAGYSITGNNASSTYGVYSTQYNTTIMNCNINNFQHGIYFNGATNGLIRDTNVSTTTSSGHGIYIYNGADNNSVVNSYGQSYSGHAIWIFSNSRNNVINNFTGISTLSSGIYIYGGSNNSIINSTGTSLGSGHGVFLWSSANNTISNVKGTSSIGRGLYIYSQSNNNLISNSNGTSDSGSGVSLYLSFNNSLFNITSASNSSFGTYLLSGHNNSFFNITGISDSSYGVYLESSSNNSFYNSKFRTISNVSAYFYGARNNLFRNNTFTVVNNNGDLLVMTSGSNNNTFYLNNFTATTGLYVNDTNGTNHYNYTYAGLNQGNIYPNVLNGSVSIYGDNASSVPGLYAGVRGSGYPYSNSTSQGKFSCNFAGCADNAPLTTLQSLQCGALSTANTIYTMDFNLNINSSTCFNVTAANVTLDCAGFNITGNNAAGGYGVVSTAANTTIKNCFISNFSEAIRLSGSADSKILNNTLNTTYASGNSVRITSNSHRANITLNAITNVNASGIYLDGGQNSTIDCQGRNIVGGNYSSTYGVYSTQYNTTVRNCNISNFDVGIYFTGSSGTISYTNVSSTFATGAGIYISGANNTVDQSRSLSFASTYLYGRAGIAIIGYDNRISNTYTAALTPIPSIRLLVSGNSLTNVAMQGGSNSLQLDNAVTRTTVDNITINTSGNGIWLTNGGPAYNNLFSNINVLSGGYAIYIAYGSYNNTFANGIVSRTSGDVVYLTNASNNTFFNLTFNSSTGTQLKLLPDTTTGNKFYLNNFTATTGLYVQDLNGTNKYNATVNGLNQGNIYANVINGSVVVSGLTASSIPGYYIGTRGPGQPYTNTTSLGKFSCNFAGCADYAPLTTSYNYVPTLSSVVLSSTSGNNLTSDNLTVSFTATDSEGDALYNNTDWRRNGTSIAVLNMPFNINTSSNATGAIRDYSTYGNNGTLGGGTATRLPTWISGKAGGAYYFDGGTDFIDVPDSDSLDLTDNITISLWIYLNSYLEGYATHPINKWTATTNANYVLYLFGNSSGNNDHGRVGVYATAGGTWKAVSAIVSQANRLNTSQWYHVAWEYKASTGGQLYINGAAYGARTGSGALYNNSIALSIGEDNFNGSIDEIMIFNRTLSAEEVAAIYANQSAGKAVTTLVRNETVLGDVWSVAVTATDTINYSTTASNDVTISPNPCGTLSTANSVYTLNGDISISGATCFNVTVANVTVDCAGYSITGNNASSTYGVYSNQFNTTVKNCNISNFDTGIFYDTNADNGTIQNTSARTSYAGSNSCGIHIGGDYNTITNVYTEKSIAADGAALYIYDSDYNTVTNAYANTSAVGYGFRIRHGNDNVMINITGDSLTYHGISLDDISLRNNFTNSTGIARSNGKGIIIQENAHFTNLIRTVANSSSGSGFYISGGQNSTIDCQGMNIIGTNTSSTYGVYSDQFNTTVKNCNISNFHHGVYFSGATNGLIDNVTAATTFTTGYAIYLASSSNYNRIDRSVGTSNSGSGIFLSSSTYNNVTFSSGTSTSSYGLYLSSANYNNLTSTNGSSSSNVGVYLTGSTDNWLTSVKANSSSNIAMQLTFNSHRNNILSPLIGSGASSNDHGIYIDGGANITLNCISGNIIGKNQTSYGIYSNQYNTTIKNCNISNFQYGIFYDYASDYSSVQNSQISSSYNQPLIISDHQYSTISDVNISSSGIGISVSNGANHNSFVNVNVTAVTAALTISDGAGYTNATNSVFKSTAGSGIVIGADLSEYNIFTNVNVSGTSYGLLLDGLVQRNVFNNMRIDGVDAGIYFTSEGYPYAEMTNLTFNKVIANGNYGLYSTVGWDNIFANSTFNGSNTAVYLSSSVGDGIENTNNRFINNTLIGNILLYIIDGMGESPGGYNYFYLNNFSSASSYYVKDEVGRSYYNYTYDGKNQGNIYANVINGSVSIYGDNVSSVSGLYAGARGTGYPYSNSTSLGKFSCNFAGCADYAPLTTLQSTQCGSLTTANTVYTLDHNLSVTGTCFTVSANNVTIDCAGYSITGDNTSTGIYSYGYNYTFVKNCFIYYFHKGVYFGISVNGRIDNTTAVASQDAGSVSIHLVNSSNNMVSNVNGTCTSGGTGIYLQTGSSNNTLENISGYSNTYVGIRLSASSGNSIIKNCLGISATSSTAILLQTSHNITVNNCTARSDASSQPAFYLQYAQGITVTNSSGNNKQRGLYILGVNHSIINNFVSLSNATYGILVTSSINNTIANSIIRSNYSNPLYIDSSNNSYFANNTLISINGTSNLLILANSSGNTFYLNNFTATTGYYVEDSNGTNFYNYTFDSKNQGNIYPNVINGSVKISGNVSSSIPGYYIGSKGSGLPYTNTTSLGKFYCNFANCKDYAPLTNSSNYQPIMVSATILPSTAYVNDTLIGYCNATDADNDTLRYHYKWFLNNALNASGSVMTSSSSFTYQEDANDTYCASGSCANIYDGDYDTSAGNCGDPNAYMNYSKPAGALSSSLWQVKYGDAAETANFSIPSICWDQSVLQFYVYESCANNLLLACWNGDSWETIMNFDYGTYYFQNLYEEGMWWNFSATGGFTQGTQINVANISSSQLIMGQNWTLECRADDSTANSTAMNSSVKTINSACTTLSIPNTINTLTGDVSKTGATCFTVTAENVTIDCAGYKITGTNTASTYGIYSTVRNTTIMNCNVSNFQHAIYFVGATYGTIYNTSASTTYTGAYGIYLISSSHYNTINNSIATSTMHAIRITSSSYNTLINTVGISSSSGNAILLTSNSYNNITNCTAISSSSASSAFMFSSSSNNRIINSVGNQTSSAPGIRFLTSNNNTVINFTAYSDSGQGLLVSSSTDNYFNNINATSNSDRGISLAAGSGNIITNSIGKSTSALGIYIATTANNITNSVFQGIDDFYYNPTSVSECSNIIQNNNGTNNLPIYYYNHTAVSITNQQTSDIVLCNASGSTINNVTSRGIALLYTNNTLIANSTANSTGSGSMHYGIYIFGGYNRIINSNGTSVTTSGIMIDTSSYNNITNAFGVSNTSRAIDIAGANNNIIQNSNGTSSTSVGIYVYSASANNTIINSSGTSTSNAGLAIGQSTGNKITGSTGISSSNYGLYMLDASSTNTVANSTLRSNSSYPAYIEASTSNTLINNTLISAAQTSTLLLLSITAGNNIFYWNNFTSTSGRYVNDTNGTNRYNYTINGLNEGNIWFNVMNTSVNVTGQTNSSGFPRYAVGTSGSGYPYSNSTSQNKFVCNFANCADYGPLTTNFSLTSVIISATILPATAYVNDTLVGYCNATDGDNDVLRYYYKWFLNGVLNVSSNTSGTYTQATQVNVANISSSQLVMGQNWTLECTANDGTSNSSAMNSSVKTIQARTPETVILKNPTNGNITVHDRKPLFEWFQSNVTSYYEVNITSSTGCGGNYYTNVTVLNYTPTNELCVDTEGPNTMYYWNVRACSIDTCGTWSDTWNFSIEPYVVINLINDTIDFGALVLGATSDTTDNIPSAFVLQNDGNVEADLVDINATSSLWTSSQGALGSKYTQIKARNSSEIGSFNNTLSIMSWRNLSTANQSIIRKLNYNDSLDSALVDIAVEVPSDEPGGSKSTSIIFAWEQTP